MEQLESSPVRKSLLTEMTTAGVDDWLFVMNVEIALVMAMILRIYSWVLIAVFLHFVLWSSPKWCRIFSMCMPSICANQGGTPQGISRLKSVATDQRYMEEVLINVFCCCVKFS